MVALNGVRARSFSGLIHDSMGVPPQQVIINPTGTRSVSLIFFPKKKAVAEKSFTVCGEQVAQPLFLTAMVVFGAVSTACSTCSSRIPVYRSL